MKNIYDNKYFVTLRELIEQLEKYPDLMDNCVTSIGTWSGHETNRFNMRLYDKNDNESEIIIVKKPTSD